MADDAIRFNRAPYKVTYRDQQGEMQTIRRVPPAKLHDALPTDIVSLTHKKNDDFDAGDSAQVVSISPRQPNVLQIRNGDGQTSFIDYYDVRLEEEQALREGAAPGSRPQDNRYLLWP